MGLCLRIHGTSPLGIDLIHVDLLLEPGLLINMIPVLGQDLIHVDLLRSRLNHVDLLQGLGALLRTRLIH